MKQKLGHNISICPEIQNWDFCVWVLQPSTFRLYFNLFPNSLKYWKLGFVNAAGRTSKFFQFMKVMEYWNFWMLASALFPNFSQFTKECDIDIIEFHLLSYFVRLWRQLIFQAWYMCRRVNLWLNCQFSRKEMFLKVYATNWCQFKYWDTVSKVINVE